MMREVAAFRAGNFRGVCPILNRAILNTVQAALPTLTEAFGVVRSASFFPEVYSGF
jgi:hypothetical protein